jgi:hypothetical protein
LIDSEGRMNLEMRGREREREREREIRAGGKFVFE